MFRYTTFLIVGLRAKSILKEYPDKIDATVWYRAGLVVRRLSVKITTHILIATADFKICPCRDIQKMAKRDVVMTVTKLASQKTYR